ncbi:hypothetical protein O5282_12855 [Escherichia coli]|nr:hypothetical protein [Escherichia coli]
MQAHEKQLSVSVIVNDMSELDVDGVLIANTDIVDAKDNNLVSITADSISSPQASKKMDLATNHPLGSSNKPDVMLIEYLRKQSSASFGQTLLPPFTCTPEGVFNTC